MGFFTALLAMSLGYLGPRPNKDDKVVAWVLFALGLGGSGLVNNNIYLVFS